jgi:putative transposase
MSSDGERCADAVPVKNCIRLAVTEFGRRGMLAARVGPEPSSLTTGSCDDPRPRCLGAFVRALLVNSAAVSPENVALRYQLAVLQRSVGRRRDRLFWVGLAPLWAGWRASLFIVQPSTVLSWHRQGFQLYWRWKFRGRSAGRPPLDLELRTLIRRMARENPTWGRRRIQAELRFLGYELAELTVAKYMQRPSPRSSPTWRTFLEAHLRDVVAVDFFVVPTLTFRLLFGFLILRHHRRELVHVNVTNHPTAAWTAHQLVESFPEETAPKYLLRDRDAIYGDVFVRRVKGLGMTELLIAPRAPWQNPFAERVIGSIRRECLDHVIVFNERHHRRLLRSYLACADSGSRPRLSYRLSPASMAIDNAPLWTYGACHFKPSHRIRRCP